MKRKKATRQTSKVKNPQKKGLQKPFTILSNKTTQSNNQTIYDFFLNGKEQRPPNLSHTHYRQIVKNPSKPKLSIEQINEVNKYIKEASQTYIFTTNTVQKIINILSESFTLIQKHFTSNIQLESVVTKFLLQLKTKVLYLPHSLTNPFEKITNEILRLFCGFRLTNELFVPYRPISNDDTKLYYEKIKEHLENYILNFEGGKALYIYSPFDHIGDISKIEIICKNLGYNIIRIDDTEENKNYRLNKIAEATKSQRIPCLTEDLNHELFILEAMVNNFGDKFNVIHGENSSSPSTSTDSTRNNSITNYFNKNTKENNLFKTIQNKIFQYCNKEKSLILIVDSFNEPTSHKFLVNIINKISGSKCPIIVLSNDITLVSSISRSLFRNNFRFCCSLDNISEGQSKRDMISQLTIEIYLHLLFGKNRNKLFTSINEIVEVFNNHSIMLTQSILERISIITQLLIIEDNYNIEVITYTLRQIFRDIEKEESDKTFEESLQMLEEKIIGEDIAAFDINHSENFDNIESMELKCEINSFKDYEETVVKRLSEKRDRTIFKSIQNAKKVGMPKMSQINYTRYFDDIQRQKTIRKTIDESKIKWVIQQDKSFLQQNYKTMINQKDVKQYNSIISKLKFSRNHELLEKYKKKHSYKKNILSFNYTNYYYPDIKKQDSSYKYKLNQIIIKRGLI